MKASIRRVLRTKEIPGEEWVQEWDDVELVERLEWLEAQRDAQKEPIVEAAAHRPRAHGRPARNDPVAWWKLPLLTVLVLAPWVVIASIVWLLAT
jgi:hypothetical protein